jgi:hypothetical protein
MDRSDARDAVRWFPFITRESENVTVRFLTGGHSRSPSHGVDSRLGIGAFIEWPMPPDFFFATL